LIFKINFQTLYLRKFTNLISLIVKGNPCQTEPIDSERTFVLSFVQSLLVYNNKTVTAEERKEALNTHWYYNYYDVYTAQ